MGRLSSLEGTNFSLAADSRALVIGTIGAGKSHFIDQLQAKHARLDRHSIDDCRRIHDAHTRCGEAAAQEAFLKSCAEGRGFFEFTGGGPLYAPVERISRTNPFDYIIRVHTPTSVCMERVLQRTDWPPYPNEVMPDSILIDAIVQELDEHGFHIDSSDWNGQPLLHVLGVTE